MKRRIYFLIVAVVVVVFAAIVSGWALNHLSYPWVLIFTVWLLVAGSAACFAGARWHRIAWINVAAAVLSAGIAETWFSVKASGGPEERYAGVYTQDYFIEHDLLGYGPATNREVSVQRYVNDTLVYDTIYSINEDGLRITPVVSSAQPSHGVLFFGGSVTFGEGVADSETMPYRVGASLADEYHVYNFGFHGYGPHQMLAALEFGLSESVADESVSDIIYQAIPAHIARVAGLAHWDRKGPRYVLNEEGGVEYTGSFEAGRNQVMNLLLPSLQRSILYQKTFGLQRPVRQADIELYVMVVTASRDRAQKLFPGSRFHVILWGYKGDPIFDAIYEGLSRNGIGVYLISDILPKYYLSPVTYQIGEHESHPSALAHELIANYVVDHILLD